jgi:type I restriction enzyme, S subunit
MKLGDVCELINGRAYSKRELLAKGKYPVLRVGNFFTNNNWYFSDMELGHEKYCDNGDLLYAWSASFGPRIWEGSKVIYHYHIWKVQPDFALIEKKFLFLWFLWDTDEIKKDHGAGTTMLHVSKSSMQARDILVPPLAEQQRIVGVLDEAFAGLATAKAHVEKNLQNARAVFESHLQSVFTQRGKGWVEKRLGDVAEVQSGGTPLVSQKQFWGGDIPWYSSGELNATYTSDSERHITNAGLAGSNAKLFPKGSLLVGMYDTAALKMSVLDRDGAFNQAIAGIKPNERIDVEFLLHAINSIKPKLLLARRGVRQKNLSLGKIKDIVLPLPEAGKQRSLASRLRAVMIETQRLEALYRQKRVALAALKKSLLHQAFSGAL